MTLLAKVQNLPLQRIARFLAVVAIAMAAGHLAQTLAARKPQVQIAVDKAKPVDIVQLSSGTAGVMESVPPQSAAVVPALPIAAGKVADAPALALPSPALEPDPVLEAVVEQDCDPQLALTSLPGAMIGISLRAGCRGAERVVLRHAGLAVTEALDAEGNLDGALPAMSADGAVDVLFADGAKVSQAIVMPDLAKLRRFGLQWQGSEAFIVHGFQDGADLGQPGDISVFNPGKVGAAGFLTSLGDPTLENPLLAQVYTFPVDPAKVADVVVEAMVTEATCGNDLLGETLLSRDGRVTRTDLTLAMPDCSAVGDFLVLKNLASDMKIAAN